MLFIAWFCAAAAGAPLTISVSGGGSLGMYQAGMLYYLRLAQLRDGRYDTVGISGASSGSMNATFLMLDPSLRAPLGAALPDPRQSLLYQSWAGVGYRELTADQPLSPQGFFDRAAFQPTISTLEAAWAAGWPEGESVVWSAAVSRVHTREVLIADGLTAPRGVEYLAARITGQGPGQPLSVQPIVDTEAGYAQAFLPLASSDDPLSLLIDTSLASAAFPLLFPPVTLPLCYAPPGGAPGECAAEAAEWEALVDGGLHDNVPLRSALRMSDPPDSAAHVFVDARLGAFPVPRGADRSGERTRALVGTLLEGVMNASSTRSMVTFLEEDPTRRERLHILPALLPQASGDLFGFMGLFQEELRAYDFMLGMVSAHQGLARSGLLPPLEVPDDAPGWAPFLCLDAVLSDRPALACAHPEAAALSAVMQVSIERLYAWCLDESRAPIPSPSWHCAAARKGAPPPTIPGVETAGDHGWQLAPGESPLDHALRRYAHHQLVFSDLGLRRPSARRAEARLRRALRRGWFLVARATPGPSLGLRLTGRAAIRAMLPPR